MSNKQTKLLQKHYELLNDTTQKQVYNILKDFTINLFEWINLPDTIDEDYLEKILFETGQIAFFKDYDLKIVLALECLATSPYNIYGRPENIKVFSRYNGYTRYRKCTTSCIVYNNRLKKGNKEIAQNYAYRIADAQRTMDVNVNAQKTPYVIAGDEDSINTLKTAYNQIQENKPLITATKGVFDDKSLNVLETNAPFVADKMMPYKRELLNEYFTLCVGIDNANTDKKERMITGEIEANDDQIERAALNMLNARKEACRRINKMFGLKLDVQIRKTESDKLTMLSNFVELKNKNAEAEKFLNEANETNENEMTLHDEIVNEGGEHFE